MTSKQPTHMKGASSSRAVLPMGTGGYGGRGGYGGGAAPPPVSGGYRGSRKVWSYGGAAPQMVHGSYGGGAPPVRVPQSSHRSSYGGSRPRSSWSYGGAVVEPRRSGGVVYGGSDCPYTGHPGCRKVTL